VVDVVAVPGRLEEAVGEAQRQDVLHRLLAEEVVDAEDAALVEGGVDRGVQRAGRGEVGAERLLEDDAGAPREAGGAEHRDDLAARGRRDGEVEEPPVTGPELGLGTCDGVGQRVVRHVGERAGEGLPRRRAAQAARGLDRLARVHAEGLVGQRAARRADDPVATRQQAGLREAEEARQQLAAGEIARAAEQDDDVVVGGEVVVEGHGGSPCAVVDRRLRPACVTRHHARARSPCVIFGAG
jgi:hypothetical protein